MRHTTRTIAGMMALAAIVATAHADSAPQRRQPKTNPPTRQVIHQDRGQQVFDRNCARCHNAPEGFPPSVSGAIAKHMRVRAGLSDEEYKALLKFFNP